MTAPLNAVYWEILRKNRWAFVVLAVLLGLGAALAVAASQAAPGTDWPAQAKRITVMCFFISIVIGFAPFTLMESSGGWRMNSMITRWFALPVRTAEMVLWPLACACVFVALLTALWLPVLNRIARGFDMVFFGAVLWAGMAAINAMAWTLPRKPAQFWVGAGMLFPIVLILGLMFQDQPGMEAVRRTLLWPVILASLGFAGFSCFAAAKNRCGAWPGELPFDRLWDWLRGGRTSNAGGSYRSAAVALFRTEAMPMLRLLAISWVGLVVLLFLFFSFSMGERQQQLAFSPRLLSLLAMGALPVFAILWMAGWSLFAAGEPSAMFRSRLTSFRATLPVSCGLLAGQRIVMLFAGWCIVWVPLVAAAFLLSPESAGFPPEAATEQKQLVSRFMSLSAFVVVGAFPVLLWGRFEGFPNYLLATICVWAGAWVLMSSLSVPEDAEPGSRWALLGALLGGKMTAAATALILGWARGHTTWRFPVVLVIGWAAVTAFVILVLPLWNTAGAWVAGCTALMIPLTRLAWSPLALAANRHRK